jgi:hypothetical protein
MIRHHLARKLTALLALLLVSMAIVAPVQAAPLAGRNSQQCVNHKHIETWRSRRQLEQKGFYFDIIGDQASITFGKNLSLDLASDPSNADYTASRITEIESELPIAERVKCWEATSSKDVVVEFRVRFDQAAPPPGLTENLFLWNAPLPHPDNPEPPIPITAVGVSRNNGVYSALVAQDFDFTTFSGLLVTQPMPGWLDAADWHRVRTTLSQERATIEVAQGEHGYTEILEVALPHPAGPLGFEFSVDNEAFPGVFVPVTVPDGLDVDFLDIRLARSR